MRKLVAVVAKGEHYCFPDRPTISVSGQAWIYDDGCIVQARRSGKGYVTTHRDSLATVIHDEWPDHYPVNQTLD